MFRKTRLLGVITAFSIAAAVACASRFYFWEQLQESDDFAVYEAFLARLSEDWASRGDTVALANTTSKLVPLVAETWVPVELRPYPPEKAAPPERFFSFCGHLCGYRFMKRNLQSWPLEPGSTTHFEFDVVPASSEKTVRARGNKRIVSVTRPGFDLCHHRAVLAYSVDCSAAGTATQVAVVCVQLRNVLVEKVNGKWRIQSYSATVL
jgi:hypothetical protein